MTKNIIKYSFFMIAGFIFGFLIGYVIKVGISADWVTAIATVVLTFSVFIAVYHNRKQYNIKKQENTVEILQYWNQNLEDKNSFVRTLAGKLNEDELTKIAKKEEFTITNITDDEYEHLQAFFSFKDKNKKISSSISVKLRWELIMYLNKLEIVCCAWCGGIVDREIIEKEFDYMFKKGNMVLKKFRQLELNQNSFPNIDLFEEHVGKKYKIETDIKEEI